MTVALILFPKADVILGIAWLPVKQIDTFIIFVKIEAKLNNVQDQGGLKHTLSPGPQFFLLWWITVEKLSSSLRALDALSGKGVEISVYWSAAMFQVLW